jgi:hypothetical protein
MLVHTIRTRLIVGAVAAAAVVAPLTAALTPSDSATHVDNAGPKCLAWFGNKDDGQCLGYSNGGGAQIGTPAIGFDQGGVAFSTSPLLPGTSFNSSVG